MGDFWEFYRNFDKSLFLSRNRNDLEFNFLKNELEGCSSVIDYGCGSGRLAIPLAQSGFKVIGLDSDQEEINLAKKKSNNKNVAFICTDYSKYKLKVKYDSAIFIYSSFGYDNDRNNIRLLEKVNNSLNNHGILVLDLLNKEWSRKTQGVKDMSQKIDLNGTNLKELYRERKLFYNANYEKTIFRYKLNNGKRGSVSFKQKLYSLEEITSRLKSSGFRIVDFWGSYDRSKYNQQKSKRLIVKAIKI
jgi:SAM-dependent methyltransferase